MNFDVKTFGCKVNTYDSGLLQKKLTQSGFEVAVGHPQIHILNSCAVTAEATKEVLRQARKIKREDPKATVVLTGCAAQVDGALVDEASEVDLVVGNSHKADFSEILSDFFNHKNTTRIHRSNIFRNEDLGEGGGEELGHTRSFLKIQDGCNSFCSFCVIPFARGKSRSLNVPVLIKKIREMSHKGLREVVLTGVHIGDYLDQQSAGGPFALEDLVEQVLNQTTIERVRLTSLEPIELTEKLMRLFENPRLCSHFHMSIQSLSTSVLKGMRRNYNADQIRESLEWIQKSSPQAFVGLDVITGFPGETDELFEETMENLKAWPWTRIHVFPYSEREGTRATTIGNSVPWAKRKERAKKMRALSSERYDQKALEQLNLEKEVLIVKKTEAGVQGLSRDYWEVFVPGKFEDSNLGELLNIRVKGFERMSQGRMNAMLVGELS